jgi:predicted dehydrogenase
MLNLGVIGTNWVTDRFIKAALATKKYQLHSVYSRNFEQLKSLQPNIKEKLIYSQI